MGFQPTGALKHTCRSICWRTDSPSGGLNGPPGLWPPVRGHGPLHASPACPGPHLGPGAQTERSTLLTASGLLPHAVTTQFPSGFGVTFLHVYKLYSLRALISSICPVGSLFFPQRLLTGVFFSFSPK